MKKYIFTKQELNDLKADLEFYSGHIRGFRGIKKKNHSGDHVLIEGKILTWMEDFKFQIHPIFQQKDYWMIHLEDAKSSIDSGNCVYKSYTFPKLKNNPELKKRIGMANFIIEHLTNAKQLPGLEVTEEDLQSHFDYLDVPRVFDRAQKVKYCMREIKEAHLRKIEYAQN